MNLSNANKVVVFLSSLTLLFLANSITVYNVELNGYTYINLYSSTTSSTSITTKTVWVTSFSSVDILTICDNITLSAWMLEISLYQL